MMSARRDTVVIGAGLGGLTTAALLARAGRSVQVIEAGPGPGGFARSFEGGGAVFDAAMHLVMSLEAEGPWGEGMVHTLLRTLGVEDRVEAVPVDPIVDVHYLGERFRLPAGRQPHVDALVARFPGIAAGIRSLFAFYEQIWLEVLRMPIQLGLKEIVAFPFRFPGLVCHRNSSLETLLDAHGCSDPVFRAVHTALWAYLGLPPSRVSAIVWAVMIGSYLAEGAFVCGGGFQRLPDALATAVERYGGELRYGSPVTAIAVRGGRVRGVTLADGSEVGADTVVASIDARRLPALLPSGRWAAATCGGSSGRWSRSRRSACT